MPNYEYLDEFAGLPVVVAPDTDQRENFWWLVEERARVDKPDPTLDDYEEAYQTARADPGAFAWRLQLPAYGGEAIFRDLFLRFVDEVDTTKVTALIAGYWDFGESSAHEPVGLLVEHADRFPALRALFLGELVQQECEISWIQQCDVTPLLAAFPRLEELRVRGGSGLKFPATRHEALRRLVVQTGGLPGEVTTGILASDLPALEHLELWFGVEDYGGTTEVGDLAPLFEGEVFPNLRSLGLCNAEWGDDLVRALADAPVMERVRALDLSSNALGPDGGEVLASAPVFRGLDSLTMDYHFVPEPVLERIRQALSGVALDLSEPEEYFVDENGEPAYYPGLTE